MARAFLLPEEHIPSHILAGLSTGNLSFSAACRELDLHKNVLGRRIAKMVSAGLASQDLLSIGLVRDFCNRLGTVICTEVTDNPAATERMRRRLADAENRARAAEQALADLDGMSELLAGITSTTSTPPNWLTDWIPGLHTSESVPVLVLTDWHYGEVVDPLQAGGYSFNPQIAERRIEATVRKTVELTKRSLAGLSYPGCVVALGGDLVSGALHPELADSDAYSVFRSITRARDLVVAAVRAMAAEFVRVYVPCAVGNHGRVFDRKPRAKGYTERNADWLIYELVADAFRDDDRVTVTNPTAGETLFSVYGTRFLLTHGDQLGARGGDGFMGAIGPISRGAQKTEKSLASLGHEVDHIILGHWHQTIFLKKATVVGSLKGPDEYALRMLRAPAEDPAQALLIVHPEHGVTFRQELFLRDDACPNRAKAAKNGSWVSVFDTAA